MRLLTDVGREALALAAHQPDPQSLAAATALRSRFDAELAAEALHQEALRRKARAKMDERARDMLFTDAGLEQATRWPVALWRARQVAALGVTAVADLGCGIGVDAMALAEQGVAVTAVDIDPCTAALAAHNLAVTSQGDARCASAAVTCADATTVEAGLPADTVVFLDPARRTARGRTWRLDDLRPPWAWVMQVAARRRTIVKLGPGIDREVLPELPVTHVSHRGDAVETTLWAGFDLPATTAVLIGEQVRTLSGVSHDAPLGPVGAFIHELDPAVSRARLALELDADLVQLDQHAGYLSGGRPLSAPWATSFEIIERLPAHPKKLARWVRDRGIGRLEIKKRGRGGVFDRDPAQMRRELRPCGDKAATLLFARTGGEVECFHVRRVCSGL